jgi:hypothetical protein
MDRKAPCIFLVQQICWAGQPLLYGKRTPQKAYLFQRLE